MRKLTVILAALVVIAAIPALAQVTTVNYANNYHYNANINCSDCHSMHASAHNNLTDGTPITDPNTTPGTAINPYYPAPNPGAGRKSLLKADDVCASCHDNKTFAPDVIGDNSNGYIRSAGGTRTNATGGGHRIGSTNDAPGYISTTINYFPSGSELECVSCHSPHGGTAFRNLVPYGMSGTPGFSSANAKPMVAKAAAWANTVTPWGTTQQSATFADAFILNGDTYTFGSGALQSYYGRGAVTYNRQADTSAFNYNGSKSSNRIDQFCGICHGAFHGGEKSGSQVGNGTDFVRHPTSMVLVSGAGTTFGTQNGAKTLKVYQAAATADPTTDSPGCLTCHKAHGNNNPFALIYPDRVGGTVPSEEGGGIYKDLCKSCHSMGGQ